MPGQTCGMMRLPGGKFTLSAYIAVVHVLIKIKVGWQPDNVDQFRSESRNLNVQTKKVHQVYFYTPGVVKLISALTPFAIFQNSFSTILALVRLAHQNKVKG